MCVLVTMIHIKPLVQKNKFIISKSINLVRSFLFCVLDIYKIKSFNISANFLPYRRFVCKIVNGIIRFEIFKYRELLTR